jgi:hypothetical protein
VLIVVEDRDVELPDQRLLDVEAVGSLDVLEVDAAEGRLEQLAGLDHLVGVLGRELDVEDVDAGEALEEHALALHHGLAGERADVPESQDGGAVGDHADQVGASRVQEGVVGTLGDLEAGLGDSGRVREREIPLRGDGLGGNHLRLSGAAPAVVLEGLFLRDQSFLRDRSPPPLPAGSGRRPLAQRCMESTKNAHPRQPGWGRKCTRAAMAGQRAAGAPEPPAKGLPPLQASAEPLPQSRGRARMRPGEARSEREGRQPGVARRYPPKTCS